MCVGPGRIKSRSGLNPILKCVSWYHNGFLNHMNPIWASGVPQGSILGVVCFLLLSGKLASHCELVGLLFSAEAFLTIPMLTRTFLSMVFNLFHVKDPPKITCNLAAGTLISKCVVSATTSKKQRFEWKTYMLWIRARVLSIFQKQQAYKLVARHSVPRHELVDLLFFNS